MSTSTTNSTDERAISLLGQGIDRDMVALTLGISESRISQLLSQDEFAERVALARYHNLISHSMRDKEYDSLEDDVLKRLKSSLGMIFDPMKLLKVLQVINQATRRGASAPEAILQKQPTVSLNIPTLLVQQFTTHNNAQNQVVQISSGSSQDDKQSLVTIQSKGLESLRSKYGTPSAPALSISASSSP